MHSQRRDVPKEEKIAIICEDFDKIDVNHDDLLTPEELNNYLDNLVPYFCLFLSQFLSFFTGR